MAKARLLQAACTVAMLAASPVFAQTNTPTGDTGAGGSANTPTTNEATPANTPPNTTSHSSGMTRRHNMAMKTSRSNTSQDAAVDRLNEQSLQAAQQGFFFVWASSVCFSISLFGSGTPGTTASGAGGGTGK